LVGLAHFFAARPSCPEALLPQTRFRVCLPGHAAKEPGFAGLRYRACSKTIYNFDSIRNFGAFAA
jgi:hypothetical protein